MKRKQAGAIMLCAGLLMLAAMITIAPAPEHLPRILRRAARGGWLHFGSFTIALAGFYALITDGRPR